ncbi:SAP30-binding protein [Coemansia sp. RSA 552]|nr:SAP30-binding protein [Coemansia sp. RSA 552]
MASVLSNALGAYDSDSDDGSSSIESRHSVVEREDTSPPAEERPGRPKSSADMSEDESEAEEPNRREHCRVEYAGVDSKQLAEYAKTKGDLLAILGCDPDLDTDLAGKSEGLETCCSPQLQDKFQQWYRLKEQGANFNEALLRNKTFRNPNIYRWFVDHLQLEEAGTNLSADSSRYSPDQLRKDFSAKQLAEEQERRARELAARKAAQSAAGTMRPVQFKSAGFEGTRTTPSTGTQRPQHAGDQVRQGGGKSFEDALQRARLIAQHLSKPNSQ